MRNIMQKAITLSLVLLLCLLPMAAQAQSLLGDRLTRAYENSRRIEATLRIDLDDELCTLMSMPQESFVPYQSLLQNTVLKVSFAQNDTDMPAISFALTIQDMPIVDGSAWLVGDKLAVATNLLPGKTLLINSEELLGSLQLPTQQVTMQAEDLQDIGAQLEKYLAIIIEWLDGTEGILTESALSRPSTQTRNAVESSVTLHITSDQLKALCIALAEAFSQDQSFMQVFSAYQLIAGDAISTSSSGELLAAVQALSPNSNAMEISILMDTQGELTGIEGVIPSMFGDGSAINTFTYDHLMNDELTRNRLVGTLTGEDGGITSITLEQKEDISDSQAPEGSFSLHIQQHSATDSSASLFLLDHTYARTLATDRETLKGQSDVNFSSRSDMGYTENNQDTVNALIASMGNFSFAFGVGFTSDTRTQGDLDFTSESTLELNLMGIKLGRFLATLSSGADTPIDTTGYTIIDLTTLSEEEMAALNEELNMGLMQVMISAMSVLPPELLQMMEQ